MRQCGSECVSCFNVDCGNVLVLCLLHMAHGTRHTAHASSLCVRCSVVLRLARCRAAVSKQATGSTVRGGGATNGGLSAEDEQRIKAAIANAKSLAEVNALEAQLKAGGGALLGSAMEE